MKKTSDAFAFNIRQAIALGDDADGGLPKLKKIIAGYSCPKNIEVEHTKKQRLVITPHCKQKSICTLTLHCNI